MGWGIDRFHQAVILREPTMTQFSDLYMYHQVSMIQFKMSMSTKERLICYFVNGVEIAIIQMGL